MKKIKQQLKELWWKILIGISIKKDPFNFKDDNMDEHDNSDENRMSFYKYEVLDD